MGNKGHSEPNLFGGYTHYDSKGKKIGTSEPDIFGGFTNYDAKGKKIGRSDPDIFGGYKHYDSRGKKIGHSDQDMLGGFRHYDASGKKTGTSDPKILGGYSNNEASGGCYIATCVYGSYDCPEVWTLRRFRDGYLSQSVPGRMFIGAYYAISPKIVRILGDNHLFKRLWRIRLDKMVRRLHEKGYDDSPYQDRKW